MASRRLPELDRSSVKFQRGRLRRAADGRRYNDTRARMSLPSSAPHAPRHPQTCLPVRPGTQAVNACRIEGGRERSRLILLPRRHRETEAVTKRHGSARRVLDRMKTGHPVDGLVSTSISIGRRSPWGGVIEFRLQAKSHPARKPSSIWNDVLPPSTPSCASRLLLSERPSSRGVSVSDDC
jgi:hypothetical protein